MSSQLSKEAQRKLVYYLALERISQGPHDPPIDHGKFSKKKAEDFLAKHTPVFCPQCFRHFLDTIQVCPVDHSTLQKVSESAFKIMVLAWEETRLELSMTDRATHTPLEAINYHWAKNYANEGKGT